MTTTSRLAAAVAAWQLPSTLRLPEGVLPTAVWDGLTGAAADDRLEGLLAAAVLAGNMPADDVQRDAAFAAAEGAASVALRLERRLLHVGELLSERGIDFRVLKGPAIAHTAYADPSLRGFGDIDLLIAPADWYRTIDALERTHAHRTLPEVRPGFDARFGKEATLLGADGFEIDLHRTFVLGPLGLAIELTALFEDCEWISLGGTKLAVLPVELRFLQACYAAGAADVPPRLHTLRDIAQILLTTPPDHDKVLARAREWRSLAMVARVVRLAWDTLGVTAQDPLVDWARAYVPRPLERAVLATYLGPGRSYTSQAASLLAIRGMRDRAAYARALLWPQSSYLESRGLTAGSHWRRGLAHVRQRRAT